MFGKSQPKFPALKPAPKTIDQLYPQLAPDERVAAEYTLKRYLNLVWRIYERLRQKSVKKRSQTKKPVKPQKIDENPFKR